MTINLKLLPVVSLRRPCRREPRPRSHLPTTPQSASYPTTTKSTIIRILIKIQIFCYWLSLDQSLVVKHRSALQSSHMRLSQPRRKKIIRDVVFTSIHMNIKHHIFLLVLPLCVSIFLFIIFILQIGFIFNHRGDLCLELLAQ